jgi:hypothetical protein
VRRASPILCALAAAIAAVFGIAPAHADDARPAHAEIATNPDNIAPTVATEPHRTVRVVGKPRSTAGHPSVIWDEEDIRRYREMMKTSPELRRLVLDLQRRMDARIGRPIDVPRRRRDPTARGCTRATIFPSCPTTPATATAPS